MMNSRSCFNNSAAFLLEHKFATMYIMPTKFVPRSDLNFLT